MVQDDNQPSEFSRAEREDAWYLGGILKRVDNFSMDTLDQRKIFQKTVYLMQAFGIGLGYDFNWYLYGVYSSELADVGFALAEIYEDVSPKRFADDDIENRFNEFNKYISDIKHDVKQLEVDSSLHYLHVNNPNMDADLIVEFLLEEKDLDREADECIERWKKLQGYGIIQ